MTSFTSLAMTILPGDWRQRKQPFRKHFASVQMPAKHTGRERITFTMGTSITRALWLNWKLLARRCQMIRGYFEYRVSLKGGKVDGKIPLETSSGHLNSTRATS